MKVTNFGPGGFPMAHVGDFGGVNNYITIGSNTTTDPPLSALNFVQRITANTSNTLLNPIVNFASGSNIILTLDQGPFPAQAYPSNTIRIHSTSGGGGGGTSPLTTKGDVWGYSTVDARIPVGADNTVLTADSPQALGVKWASGGGGSGALVLLEQHTASASAQLDFTTFISATYDDYEFRFVDILPSTDGGKFRMRMGTGGGPTYDTGSNYHWCSYVATSGAAGQNGGTSVAFIGIGAEEGTSTVSSSSFGFQGRMAFSNPNSAIFKKVSGNWNEARTSGPSLLLGTIAGTYNSATAVTAVRFYFDTGNIASGTIRVYGLTK